MKVCIVHNEYGKPSGEESMVCRIVEVLRRHGNAVCQYSRSSAEIGRVRFGAAFAFFTGIHNPSATKAFAALIRREKPDIVQVQNVFPLISPSILGVAKHADVPIVFRCANYRLICPNGLLLSQGVVCERCVPSAEYWCVLRNCENSMCKSIGYSLRSFIARFRGTFTRNVSMYVAQNRFQRDKLVSAGYPADRFAVVPNMAQASTTPRSWALGEYVAFCGRLGPEKGIPSLLRAAAVCPSIPFRAAGAYDRILPLLRSKPANFTLLGHLPADQLEGFYTAARLLVVCSTCYEGFPGVIIEAMLRGKAVVCSRIGGLPEIVEDGVTGLLFEPGDGQDLADKINYLWNRPDLCRQMGQAGREKALREYSPEKYYERLMAVYRKAIALGPGGPR